MKLHKFVMTFTLFLLVGLVQASPYFPAQGDMTVTNCIGLDLRFGDSVKFVSTGALGVVISTEHAGTLKAENNGSPAFGTNGGFFGFSRNEPTEVNGQLVFLYYRTIRGFEGPRGVLAHRGEKVVVLEVGQRDQKTIRLKGATERAQGDFKTFDCTLVNQKL